MITKPNPRINRTAATLNKYRPQTLGAPAQQGSFSGTPGSLQKPQLGGGGTKPIVRSQANSPFQQGPQLGGNRQVQSSFNRPNEYRFGARGEGSYQPLRRPVSPISGNAPAAPGVGSPPAVAPGVGGSSPKPAWASGGVNPSLTQQAPPAQAPAPGSWASEGFAGATGALQNGLHRIDPGNFASMMTDAQGTANTIRGLGAYDPGTAPAEEPLDPFGSSGAGLSAAPQPEQGAQEELYGTSGQGLRRTGAHDYALEPSEDPYSQEARRQRANGRLVEDVKRSNTDGSFQSNEWERNDDPGYWEGKGYTREASEFAAWLASKGYDIDQSGQIRDRNGGFGGQDGTLGGYLGDNPEDWDPHLRALWDGFQSDPARVAARKQRATDERNARIQESLGLIPDAPQLDQDVIEAQVRADEQLRAMAAARGLNAAIGDNRGRLGVGATAGLTAQTMQQSGAEHALAAGKLRVDAMIQNFQAQLQNYDAKIGMLMDAIDNEQDIDAREFQKKLLFELEDRRAKLSRELGAAEEARADNAALAEFGGRVVGAGVAAFTGGA